MNEVAFVERREPGWKRLGTLCDLAEASPRLMESEQFHELVRLYRRASTDLAIARTRGANPHLIEYLNDLVGRAYALLYREPRPPFGRVIGNAVALAARTVRECRYFVLASILLFVAGASFSFFVQDQVPQTQEIFVPESFRDSFDAWKEGTMDARTAGEGAMATGFYASNNPRVAVISGAIAASTFGLGTAYLLFNNGILLGSLLHYVQPEGRIGHVLIWISPHGVPELTGIFVAGASGLVMGAALINPSRYRRGQALKRAGRKAIVLLATAAVLMFIAAPIEGYFSFDPRIPDAVKVTFSLITFGLWLAFWTYYGRSDEEAPERDKG